MIHFEGDIASCHICGQHGLTEISVPEKLRTVTSDCRPWKEHLRLSKCLQCGQVQTPVDQQWRSSTNEIYSKYDSYFQSAIKDQLTFDEAGANSRTGRFCESVLRVTNLAQGASVLDYGCGSGNVTKSCKQLRPDLVIDALDLASDVVHDGQFTSQLRDFFVGELPRECRYDLIVLSHSLEHIDDPCTLLRGLKENLTKLGQVAIAVPNCETDPIKLLVADHCTHFNQPALEQLLRRCGMVTFDLGSDRSSREILLLASPVRGNPTSFTSNDWVDLSVARVSRAKRILDECCQKDKSVAVFGTSVAGAWVLSEFPDAVALFVDEDQNRQGYVFNGYQIVAPTEVPTDLKIVVPLMGATDLALRNRLITLYGRDRCQLM